MEKSNTRVADLAARQWGVVDLDDLRECGLSRRRGRERVHAGTLFRLLPRRVRRRVSPALPRRPFPGRREGLRPRRGPVAFLGRGALAAAPVDRAPPARDVSRTSQARRDHAPPLGAHRAARSIKGIPVVTPARALFDVSSMLPYKSLRAAVNQAFGLELVTLTQLIALPRARREEAAPRPRHGRADEVREREPRAASHPRGRPPPPLVNPRSRARTTSPTSCGPTRLILEADSRRFHGNMIARADDATRQLVLETMGLRVIRTTWREATTHPAGSAAGRGGAVEHVLDVAPARGGLLQQPHRLAVRRGLREDCRRRSGRRRRAGAASSAPGLPRPRSLRAGSAAHVARAGEHPPLLRVRLRAATRWAMKSGPARTARACGGRSTRPRVG